MAAPNDEKFSGWLSNRLLELDPDIDVEVFAGYITSILEDDVSNEETIEALTDFLSQVTEQDTTNISSQITQKWKETHEENQTNDAGANSTSVDDRLSAIMEKSKISVALKKETTSEDDTLKQAILQQYSQISDGEETDDSRSILALNLKCIRSVETSGSEKKYGKDDQTTDAAADSSLSLMARNTNASDIDRAEREKRDKLKQAHEAKKDKDKADREKQKGKQLERKDKEKQRTQKGEKRR